MKIIGTVFLIALLFVGSNSALACYVTAYADERHCTNDDSMTIRITNVDCDGSIRIRACLDLRNGKRDCGTYLLEEGKSVSHYACKAVGGARVERIE